MRGTGRLREKPALDDAEITDIIAFLGTLTDGYRPTASTPRTWTAARAAAGDQR